jgi:hypothetical protein
MRFIRKEISGWFLKYIVCGPTNCRRVYIFQDDVPT